MSRNDVYATGIWLDNLYHQNNLNSLAFVSRQINTAIPQKINFSQEN